MNQEPKEGKAMGQSARGRDGSKPERNDPAPSDLRGTRGTGEDEVLADGRGGAPGDVSNATNVPPISTPRKTAAHTSTRSAHPEESHAEGAEPEQHQEEPKPLAQENGEKDITIAGQMIINSITEYAQNMKPGRLIPLAEGMRHQVSLCNAIFVAINTLDADFKPVLTEILGILHRERDAAFCETHLFRYWDTVPLSKTQRRGFEKIITLLKTLADPKTRPAALRQVDFERLLQYGLTDKGRTHLAAYFGR